MFPMPTSVFLTRGVGVHRFLLTAFEFALRDADIEQQNLVTVSSILPPGCDLIPREVGVATLTEVEDGTQVDVQVTGLPPGFHGFHLHAVGVCEPDSPSPADPSMTGDFLSAGGHIGAGETDHGEHAGDLPLLYVTEAGTGTLTAVTDALTLDQLTDGDGSAVMVHADPDNYANVPERYAPGGPDQMTRNTGDAGGRIACGPVEG